MAFTNPVIGLGDSHFEADLHTKDIDHDFFDGPNDSSQQRPNVQNLLSNANGESEEGIESSQHSQQEQHKERICDTVQLRFGSENFDLPIRQPLAAEHTEKETTLENSPLRHQHEQHMFSTGLLLESLTQGGETVSLTSRTALLKEILSNGTPGTEIALNCLGIPDCPQNRRKIRGIRRALPRAERTVKLFDISSSSSEDESGRDALDSDDLDDDDDVLVNLLEKYYLGGDDSDYSDITEVSPMSSLSASPLPTNILNASEDSNVADGDIECSLASASAGSENGFSILTKTCAQQRIILHKPKPIIPLTVSTGDPDATGYSGSNGNFHFHGTSWHSQLLLQTASPNGNSSLGTQHKNGHFGLLAVSPGASSSTSDNSSISNGSLYPPGGLQSDSGDIGFKKRSAVGSSSTISTSSSLLSLRSRSGLQGKNHTFTVDQVKRIERDNNILLKKILDTQTRLHSNHGHHGHAHGHNHGHHHHFHHHHERAKGLRRICACRSLPAPSSISRLRLQKKIEHDNLVFLRRLQNVKPSKEIGEAFKNPK